MDSYVAVIGPEDCGHKHRSYAAAYACLKRICRECWPNEYAADLDFDNIQQTGNGIERRSGT